MPQKLQIYLLQFTRFKKSVLSPRNNQQKFGVGGPYSRNRANVGQHKKGPNYIGPNTMSCRVWVFSQDKHLGLNSSNLIHSGWRGELDISYWSVSCTLPTTMNTARQGVGQARVSLFTMCLSSPTLTNGDRFLTRHFT